MPKKTRHKNEPNFYETLTPSLPYRRFEFADAMIIEGTPFWVYPAWIVGSVILGVLLGLAIKDFETPKPIIAKPGVVAKILDPQRAVASIGLTISQKTSQVVQGNSAIVQGDTSDLQTGQSILAYQNGFSGYGQQGSVGISASMQ